jgi:glutamyl-tRNA synthetase
MDDRLKLFSDILVYAGPFLKPQPEYDPAAVDAVLRKPGNADLLREAKAALAACEPFDAPTAEKTLVEFCTAKGLKPGVINQPMRVAVTGVSKGPGVFETLAIFGKAEVLRRIDLALKLV